MYSRALAAPQVLDPEETFGTAHFTTPNVEEILGLVQGGSPGQLVLVLLVHLTKQQHLNNLFLIKVYLL